MTLGIDPLVRNAELNAITTAAGASATIKIYSGTRPATSGTVTTLLVTLTCNATFAPAASSGVLTLNAIASDVAASTGTASWFRLATSGGTAIMDGDVAVSASDLNLNTTSIVSGGTVGISSFVLTAGNP